MRRGAGPRLFLALVLASCIVSGSCYNIEHIREFSGSLFLIISREPLSQLSHLGIMSASTVYPDVVDAHVSSEEDQRALQIALELSNLGLLGAGDDDSSTCSYDDISKSKKSQNMTECVPVPSSEHVAEIVGRQGCKIKALRAKTSTYIKTPVRGEEPVFVVTGRKEDVAMARREIQSAAEHFTQIRATRNKPGPHTTVTSLSGLTFPLSLSNGSSSPDLASPGTITLQVRVPYRVVGLVVGPKGSTIKRIQQQTHTYIVTPSRDKEPVFEVTGLPENVEKAKEEIEAHIAARTGNMSRDIDDDFASNGTVVGSPANLSPYRGGNILDQALRQDMIPLPPIPVDEDIFNQLTSYSAKFLSNAPSASLLNLPSKSGYDATVSTSWYPLEATSVKTVIPSSVSTSAQQPSLCPSGSRLSPTFSDGELPRSRPEARLNHSLSQPLKPSVLKATSDCLVPAGSSGLDINRVLKSSVGMNIESGYSSGSNTDSQTSGSPVEGMCYSNNPRSTSPPRICVMCKESNVIAALVPCGHNHFCYECANKTAKSSAPCPCCNQPATYALLIKT